MNCSIEGCEGSIRARGWCRKHYERWKSTGDPLALRGGRQARGTAPATCTVEGCDKPHLARGYCGPHYMRVRTDGVPGEAAMRKLPNGSGHTSAKGYRVITLPDHPNSNAQGRILVHRRVMSDHLGRPLRKDEYVHHKNGRRADNRLENLELCVKDTHPPGQRVEDRVAAAKALLARYGDMA